MIAESPFDMISSCDEEGSDMSTSSLSAGGQRNTDKLNAKKEAGGAPKGSYAYRGTENNHNTDVRGHEVCY